MSNNAQYTCLVFYILVDIIYFEQNNEQKILDPNFETINFQSYARIDKI